MATIADELNAISVEHGYTGAAPKTIAGAIDALADTLAGEDVEERRTIAGAINALAPYIGAGGGGGFEPKGMWDIRVGINATVPIEMFYFAVDSRGPLQSVSDSSDYGNVYRGVATSSDAMGTTFGTVGGGLYVAVAVTVSSAEDTEKLQVKYDDETMENVTKFVSGTDVLLSFQAPESDLQDTGSIFIDLPAS